MLGVWRKKEQLKQLHAVAAAETSTLWMKFSFLDMQVFLTDWLQSSGSTATSSSPKSTIPSYLHIFRGTRVFAPLSQPCVGSLRHLQDRQCPLKPRLLIPCPFFMKNWPSRSMKQNIDLVWPKQDESIRTKVERVCSTPDCPVENTLRKVAWLSGDQND